MRAYNFKFVGRNGTVETEYLIDLDKICFIGQVYFDPSDGIAWLPVKFQRTMGDHSFRFLTEYEPTDRWANASYRGTKSLEERVAIMRKTEEDFISTVDALKAAWIAEGVR